VCRTLACGHSVASRGTINPALIVPKGGGTLLALYHNDMSCCAQKVRLCLSEKGLEWESRHLNLRAGEHQQDWYLKLNPRAVVPTLVDGDIVVPESNVINEYLDDRFPRRPLRPADALGLARMRLWTKQLDEGVHDASNRSQLTR
jgi:glutathione S-transferase